MDNMFNVIVYLLDNNAKTDLTDNNGNTFWDNLSDKYHKNINIRNNAKFNRIEIKPYTSNRCSICLEEITNNQMISKCRHVFHIKCIYMNPT